MKSTLTKKTNNTQQYITSINARVAQLVEYRYRRVVGHHSTEKHALVQRLTCRRSQVRTLAPRTEQRQHLWQT